MHLTMAIRGRCLLWRRIIRLRSSSPFSLVASLHDETGNHCVFELFKIIESVPARGFCRYSHGATKCEHAKVSDRKITHFLVQMDYVAKIRLVLRTDEWDMKLEKALTMLNVPWDNFIINDVLKSLSRTDMLWKFFDWLETEGFKHDIYTYNSMIEFCGRNGDIEGIDKVVCRMEEAGCELHTIIVDTLLYWYDKFDRVPRALELWDSLDTLNCKRSIITYTTFMALLSHRKQYKEVASVYRKMLADDCKPNARTYDVLISCLLSLWKIDLAFEILEKMPLLKISPIPKTYGTLLLAFAAVGDVTMMNVVYQKMCNSGLLPREELFQQIKSFLNKVGRLKEATSLLQDMELCLIKDKIIEPNQLDDFNDNKDDEKEKVEHPGKEGNGPYESEEYSCSMFLLARVLQTWGPETEEVLFAAKIKWDCSKVSKTLSKFIHWRPAWSFFNWVKSQDGYEHNSYTFAKMATILIKYRKVEVLEELLEQVYKAGSRCHDAIVLNAFLLAFSKAGLKAQCMHLIYWMHDAEIKPNGRTFTYLIVYFCKMGSHEKALEMYSNMIASGFIPDSQTCTALIDCLGQAKEIAKALEIFREMPKYYCHPTALTYTVLIDAYFKEGQPAKATALYNEMQKEGVEPSLVTYEMMIKGLRRAGRTAVANTVIKARNSSEYAECETIELYFEKVVQNLIFKNLENCESSGSGSVSEVEISL